jgi:hypothetical protein
MFPPLESVLLFVVVVPCRGCGGVDAPQSHDFLLGYRASRRYLASKQPRTIQVWYRSNPDLLTQKLLDLYDGTESARPNQDTNA